MGATLDITALRSLVSIADAGGVRRAADLLHLSQSAVSQHVRRLEQACGCALVERYGNGVRFTASGDLLVIDARKILGAHDSAIDRLRRPEVDQSVFVVGATEHAADLLLPAISEEVRTAFPEATVRFRIDRGHQLNERLDSGTIDASLLLGEVHGRDAQRAGALPLAWYASASWRRPRDLAEALPFVAIDEPCTIRRRAIQILTDDGSPPTVVCESAHLAGVVHAARAGLGVALLAHLGPSPEGLVAQPDLPDVAPEPLHVRGRAGAPDRLLAAVAAAAIRATALT